MARYKFRMEFMIGLRRRREEAAAAKLAKRLASIRELERIIAALEGELAGIGREVADRGLRGELNGPLLSMYSSHQERLRKEIKRNAELLALSRAEEAKERLALKKAMIDRKIIEKAKERGQAAWREETARAEQNGLEELAAIAKERSRRSEASDGDQQR
jgi:flagellar export protein FliJ